MEFYIIKKEDKNGIPTIITNVLYQGKEIYYTVTVLDKEWEVHTNCLNKFEIGDKVSLHYNNEGDVNAL